MASLLDQPAVQSYVLYSGILALKVLGVAVLTSRARYAKKVFSNPEDLKAKPNGKIKFDDPDVERVRRAHLNDLENIPAFWVLGALYLTTSPEAAWATTLFRVFTAGRILHTIVYAVKPLPQPARGIAFGIPFMICIYMGVKVVAHYANALVFTAGRILHTIVYAVKPLPQPARGIAFGIPFMICIYMGVKVVAHYANAL